MKNKTLKTMTCAAMATTLSISPFLALTEAYAMSQAMDQMAQESQSTSEEGFSNLSDELLESGESLQKVEAAELEAELVLESETESQPTAESKLDIEPTLNIESEEMESVLLNEAGTEVEAVGIESGQEINEKNAQTFNLSEWIYTENEKYISITAPRNARENVYIPGQYQGKQVIIADLKVFPVEMTHLTIEAVNGVKVGLKAIDLTDSFGYNETIKSLDLRGLDVSRVTKMERLFAGLTNLTAINLEGWNTARVTTMDEMFQGVSKLTQLNLDSFDTSNVTSMNGMFSGMEELSNLSISSFNTSKVTTMERMFQWVRRLQTLNLQSFKTANVKSMESMFDGMESLNSLNLTSFQTHQVENMNGMFQNTMSLSQLDLSSFDTSSLIKMERMFSGMHALTSLDLSHFNTSKVDSMSYLFYDTPELKELNISNFDTSSVENMSGMFAKNGVAKLDLEHFDVSITTDMSSMFQETTNLSSLNVRGWDVSKVTTMSSMFESTGLRILDLSTFKPSKLKYGSCLFAKAKDLRLLDISHFNFNKLENYDDAFLLDESVPNELVLMINNNSLRSYDFKEDKRQVTFMSYEEPLTSSTAIKGTGAYGTRIQFSSRSEVLGTIEIDETETFNFQIPKQAIGTVITMEITTPGYEIVEKELIIQETFLTFTVDNIPTPSTTSVTGKGTPGARITVFSETGERIALTTVDSHGNYKVTFKKQELFNVLTFKQIKKNYVTAVIYETVLNEFKTFETPAISSASTTLYGTGVAGATVGLYTEDERCIATTTVNSKGNYKLTIPKQKAGTVLTYRQSKKEYVTLNKKVTVLDEFKTFTLKQHITDKTTAVYGTGVPGAKVGIYTSAGKRLALTTVNSKGNYKLVIPAQKGGSTLILKQAKEGYLTISKNIPVYHTFKTFTLKQHITNTTTAVYGTGVPGAKVGIYTSAGKRLAITTVNSKGNYKLVIPKQKAGTTLILKQAKSGYLTVSKNVTVLNELKTFTVPQVKSSSTTLYGKGVAGSKVGIYTQTGKRLAITTVNSKGNYKLVIPKQKTGTVLIFKQAKSGYLTLSQAVKVTK